LSKQKWGNQVGALEKKVYQAMTQSAPASMELKGVTKEFIKPSGEVHTVLRNIDLKISKG
jgi:NitT/TauT family transport system ATP-binding protein